MKVLTAAQMREADRRSIEVGIPGLVLMENAAYAFLRELEKAFPRLAEERMQSSVARETTAGMG